MELTDLDAARFWSKVDRSGECWEWSAYRSKKGYGQFRVGRVVIAAHRVAFTLELGDIEPGMQVDHRCLNKACVRPAHLRQVTNKQNSENRYRYADSDARGAYRRHGRWYVRVMHEGRSYSVGRGFDTPEQAAEAATALRNRLFTHNDKERA